MENYAISGTYTDLYQLSMAQVYFLSGKSAGESNFDYFFRKLPFGNGYVVFAGLGTLLEIIQQLKFMPGDLEFLKESGFNSEFVKYIRDFRFSGNIYSAREGEIVFPGEPILRVEGPLLEAQILETLILNILNFQSLIATKASRMRQVAGDKVLVDFGLRRAQGLGGYHATRAAVIGGFDATSNVKAAKDFNIPAVGTMAHSFIQSYDEELSAFRDFCHFQPQHCVLLTDTYDTLGSGVKNAIIVAKEMETRLQRLEGIRLDSGDLAYLSKQARKMLDEAGLEYVKIVASNQLDEWIIDSLNSQGAPIDIFGVGTSLVTGPPDAALDGVYKLSYANDKPRIKLSESLKKVSLPGKKQILRLLNEDGLFYGADVITLENESQPGSMYHPFEADKSINISKLVAQPLLHKTFENGNILFDVPSLIEIALYKQERMKLLPEEYKRFAFPHTYKVGISQDLMTERNRIKHLYKK